jgi:broad specificity phosphatase PhoE
VADRASGLVVAMVSHADVIRAAVAGVIGLSLDRLLAFDIDPASVTRIEAGPWGERLVTLNEREL